MSRFTGLVEEKGKKKRKARDSKFAKSLSGEQHDVFRTIFLHHKYLFYCENWGNIKFLEKVMKKIAYGH